jgi:hypothetical protein
VDRLDPLESKRVRDAFGTADFRLWAPKASDNNEAIWERMCKGDLVLLYPHGEPRILRCFEITGTLDSPALGKLVWGATAPGVVFRHLYSLGEEKPCKLDLKGFNEVLGYAPNYKIQGFGVYDYARALLLIDAIGSGS